MIFEVRIVRAIAWFASIAIVCAGLTACGGGDSASNDCSGGKNVYTNLPFVNAALESYVGKAITPQTPSTPGIPASCMGSTHYSVASGQLPPGITLDSRTGTIAGTPTQAGIFSYQIQLTLDGFTGSVSNGIAVDVADPNLFSVAAWKTANSNLPMTDDFRLDALGSQLVSLTAGFYSHTMDTYVSSDAGKTWSIKSITGPQPFTKEFSTTSDGTSLYYSAGVTGTGAFPAGVWKFDGAAWTQRTATGFPARKRHALVKFNSALYAIGGVSSTGAYLGDVWQSTDDGATWTNLGTPFSGRADVCAAVFQGQLVVVGGYGANTAYADVWTSIDGQSWQHHWVTPTSSPFFAGVIGPQCAVANGRLYATQDFGVVSTTDLKNWNFEPFMLMSYRAPGMAVLNGALYFASGTGTSMRTLTTSAP